MNSQSLFDEVRLLATEQRNPDSLKLDEMSTEEVLRLINREDAKVAKAVESEIPHITAVVDELVRRFKRGGKLFYVGAGTSGRMGVVDAAECPPTFGTPRDQIEAIIAGGHLAVFQAQEGAEDRPEFGAHAIQQAGAADTDMVIGIAASKRTPFVLGALERGFTLNAYTVLLTTNPRESVGYPYLSETICPVVGPEVLMGSTRMKSALAQKMVLTMITTTAMVRMGKVYQNMMVDLQLTNRKLEERAKRIVMIATDCDYEQAKELLEQSGGHVKSAIIMRIAGSNKAEADRVLAESDGFVKRAIEKLRSK
ncbi:MAG: N-acetylmuramic acid 6-phosphate etherase [Bacteroidota bacterium]|nr:N-acetylmuramic acid 6-phosphate etherase [Bacteroidota bacterium]MDP4232017.1 N-acetylmuramic acid 6-phosphate etherase [Bacteroidota bacterium]MDP4241276.1 N-acetylmuramic acid 6-phosphate etherase [Bacteroidota bacterium]MDP4286668.1 N-acetylmuramic acid 6-phosphate etherase [Bacteroidota bacterium]